MNINFKYFIYAFIFECSWLDIDIHYKHRDSFKALNALVEHESGSALFTLAYVSGINFRRHRHGVLRKNWRRVRRAGQSLSRPLGHNGSATNAIVIGSSCPWPRADDALERSSLKPFNYPLTLRMLRRSFQLLAERDRDIIYNVTHYALSFASFLSFVHFALDVKQCVADK